MTSEVLSNINSGEFVVLLLSPTEIHFQGGVDKSHSHYMKKAGKAQFFTLVMLAF